MSEHPNEIDELLDEADTLPYGPQERALLDRAVAAADAAGDEDRGYQARMRLVASAKMSGDTDTMLAAFAWCVGKNDADPVRFPAKLADAWDLLWYFKWMAGSLLANPRFELDRIEAVESDMERRFVAAGVGLSGVAQSRFWTAASTGQLDLARRMREVLEATPRDEYSHCEACVRSEAAWFEKLTGNEERALALLGEIHEQGLQCAEEPERADSDQLLPLLRAGRTADAATAHMRSYRAARSNPDNITIIANHWEFCAVTGNEARGLMLLERHLREVMTDPMNFEHRFHGARQGALLLDAVTRAGHGDTPVRHSEDPVLEPLIGSHEGPWTATELAAALWAAAEGLAAAFDERNGNDFHARMLATTRALADERYEVPLEGEGYTPPTAPAQPAPSTAPEWLQRAREKGAYGDHDGALDAADRALALADEAWRPEVLRLLINALVGSGNVEHAEAVLTERGDLLRASGRTAYAEAESRLGLKNYGGWSEADLGVFSEEITTATAAGAWDLVCDLTGTRADLHQASGHLEAALVDADAAAAAIGRFADQDAPQVRPLLEHAALQRAGLLLEANRPQDAAAVVDSALGADPSRLVRSRLLRLRAQAHAAAGDLTAALPDAEAALALTVEMGSTRGTLGASYLSAQILSDLDRDGEAAARLRYAVREAEREGLTPLVFERYKLGQFLTYAGQHEQAVEVLDEVYRAESEAEAAPGALAETMLALGNAAAGGEQWGVAYGAFRRALEHALESGVGPLQVNVGTRLARMLVQFEDEEALEVLDEVLEAVKGSGDEEGVLRTMSERALALSNLGRPEALDAFDEVIRLADAAQNAWVSADARDSKARGLARAERYDEGVRLALQAADAYQQAGDPNGAASADALAAQMLRTQGKAEEALSCYASAIERGPNPGLRAGLESERDEYLAELG